MSKIKVLFVCLGNICRSPMAEGIFQHLVQERQLEHHFEIDSAGTSGWHNGELPDPNMMKTAALHGINLESRSRKFIKEDFEKFDYIIPMDQSNLRNMKALQPTAAQVEKLHMMRAYDKTRSGADVEDPYGMAMDGFERCYQVLLEANSNFLEELVERHELESSKI
ncbi:low molecular weight protein-tyrosine-phosphatase [Algivirga pacifica]|uniref:protein-tyrosine-phosphatase n=1 Tax=Algivirga pacifica TaxID=1162670 RepID=A0ABP9CY72_9BACT